jgi:hypothetical protein
LAKLFKQIWNSFATRNAPAAPKKSGGGGGAINRDPKAIQVKRIGYQISNAQGGGGGGRENFESPKVDFTVIGTAIERDSYIMQAVMKYEELLFKSGFAYQTKNDQALQYLNLRLDMMSIATLVSTNELWHGIARDIVRYSNAFVVKSRAKGGKGMAPGVTAIAVPPAKDPIAGYFLLPPSTIQIARDPNGNVMSYQQQIPGQQNKLTFRPEDVVHIKVNVPSGEAFGLPWLAPVLDDIRLLRKVEENAALLLYRHIFPLLAYTVGLDKPGFESTDEELEALRSVIQDMPTDGAIVLPERHKIEAVNLTAIDGRPYLDYFEQRVFSGIGLSQVDYGRGDTANRNTADAMSGVKTDRVKGWQQQIQYQITKGIIEELLVEGGFDPLVNPDYAVAFSFNEIEQEMRIKMDTHEIFKFEHNLQSWEESRKNMSLDPTTDETRLYLNMIQIPLADAQANAKAQAAGTSSTNNKQQPSNQHGKTAGPKRSTQSDRWSVDLKENAMVSNEKIDTLTIHLETVYQSMENDVLDEVKRLHDRRSFPVQNTKNLLSSVYFGKEKMRRFVQKDTHAVLLEGMKQSMNDTSRDKMPAIDTALALIVISESSKDSFELMETTLHDLLSKRMEGVQDQMEAVLAVKGAFQSLRHRLRVISKTILMKSYHYGYVLGMIRYGESEVYVHVAEGECPKCQAHAQEKIDLLNMGRTEEVAIFHKIPPFHPNCECEISSES